MIKSYLELSCDEKDKLLVFLNRNNQNVALSEMRKMFENKVYGNGDGILVFKDDNRVICVGRVVLKEIPLTGIAYIHFLDILESLPNKKEVIKEMINECYKKAEKYNANKILLGFRKKETTEMLHKIGFDADYAAKIMILKDRTKKEKVLNIEEINKENKLEYMRLYNESFNNMPHGASLDEEEAEEYLNENNTGNKYFIVSNSKENIGVLNTTIKGKRGTFDIGLSSKFRGKGYGKRLLETAIDFLECKDIENVYLIVIETNKIAYKMYKKRGFMEDRVLSYWISLK
ncbi:acetyltransferase domain protein [Clostridium baratii str. Sullivan]|uniref:Acetyltransferase domain protein n=1 Tax=Clostridium baratii str. Sullivan TaxID=1415775 RepID=A0A0A7FWA6_9CLOT|nr:GNAT family N-acetyltransferase [Clostridium baratii]AIY83215.1 acetyltransferase domain protein [Clostridium baratii str. Sullivan]